MHHKYHEYNTPVYHISQQPSYHAFLNISSLISRNANELGISSV